MAKIKISGDAVVITSALKREDIELVEKYDPKKLQLMGGEDGKEPVFAIATSACPAGCLNSVGAAFGGETYDAQKLATLTLSLSKLGISADCGVEELKDKVADNLGAQLASINAIEAAVPEALTAIRTANAAVRSAISVG